MSRQSEERNRQKFAEKMRQKSLADRNTKLTEKKTGAAAPAAAVDENKKD
jgi:hypothetical protein